MPGDFGEYVGDLDPRAKRLVDVLFVVDQNRGAVRIPVVQHLTDSDRPRMQERVDDALGALRFHEGLMW